MRPPLPSATYAELTVARSAGYLLNLSANADRDAEIAARFALQVRPAADFRWDVYKGIATAAKAASTRTTASSSTRLKPLTLFLEFISTSSWSYALRIARSAHIASEES